MPLWTRIPNVAIPIAGVAITHGLTDKGAAITPDEYHMEPKAAPPAAQAFWSSTPADNTFVYLTAGSTQTVDVFARYNHSMIR